VYTCGKAEGVTPVGSGAIIGVNGREVPAYVVQLDGGLRVRFALDDWEGLCLYRGQRVPVRLTGRPDDWLFLAEVVEAPPVTWVLLVRRF
jgi:hypothetical protein